MAKEWAEWFYNSGLWRTQRDAYKAFRLGVCELCGGPGEIVHHKTELTPLNIHDPHVSLSFDNLQLVCRDCHGQLHGRTDTAPGFRFDANGELIAPPTA